MSTSDTLQELTRQVRGDTLKILESAEPEWVRFAPSGTSNHMLWHAGHALWVQDLLCIQLLTGGSELPDGWADSFGMDCRPVQETSEWPSIGEMSERLQTQLDRLLHVQAEAGESELARVANPSRGPMSVAARIIHGVHDEAKHSGEMYLLLKMCRGGAR